MSLRLFCPPALLAFVGCTLCAQVETSTAIRGLVTDTSGAAIGGAKVTIRNAATGEERSTLSESNGSYSLPSVVPGRYSVNVTHPGFKRAEITDRTAGVAQIAQVDVMLQVGE